MKRIVSTLLLSLSLPAALQAKGLDKLQPTTEQDREKEEENKESKGIVDRPGQAKPGETPKEGEAKKEAETKPAEPKETIKPAAKAPVVPVEPGFQEWYVGASLSWINIDGREGDWDSSSTGDLEIGYRLAKKYSERYDIYLTGRYRPADVTIRLENRAYRGVLESYLLGVKGQMDLAPRLIFLASAEAGLAKTSVSAIDGIQQVDGSLEKSGVDLVIGAGVSYLVLEKLALGTQLHLGGGAHKTVQLGVDLRFLL